MSSVVSDFIIQPALRQVRRFSRPAVADEADSESSQIKTNQKPTTQPSSREDAISESEEDSYVNDEQSPSDSAAPSSRSSMIPHSAPGASRPLDTSEAREPSALYDAAASLDRGAARDTMDQTNLNMPETLARDLEMPDAATISPDASMVETQIRQTSALVAAATEPLPADDGMGPLRRRILELQARNLPAADRARLMHKLLMEGYTKSQIVIQSKRPESPSSIVSWEQRQAQKPLDSFKFWQGVLGEASIADKFVLTEDDIRPTFAPLKEEEGDSEFRALGCEHYRRNVKLQCSTCARWYTCRFCHDNVEDHALIRKDTKNMLCMFCGIAQRASEACLNCGEAAAVYYCSICKLWNNDPDKSIYHCNDCGICRIGRGLGKDFFHCKKCCACLAISIENDHKCIERSLDCDCPICGEYMFNSPRAVCFMKCGHALHRDCWDEHIKTAYKCPICNKSVVNMETQFRNLEIAIMMQPMPEKFQDTRAVVLCNDCSAKTTVSYHWLGLKCAVCRSYNTSELQILGIATQMATSLDVPSVQVLDTASTQPPLAVPSAIPPREPTASRDIPTRRRHSSNAVQMDVENLNVNYRSYLAHDRLARSVSPVAAGGLGGPTLGTQSTEGDFSDEEESDMIGLWSRVPRSITSNENLQHQEGSDEESTSSVEDMEEESDEDVDEPINLLGHR